MHALKAVALTALSALVSTIAATTMEPQKLGLIGPENMMLFLNGFHFISGEPNHYLQANHHCVLMNSDFIQCAIYIPGSNPARLAGVEYIISGAAFSALPMSERQLWHSHQYEVTSGYLTEPGLPQSVDDEVMKILVNSYGKTFHTWRYDQKNGSLPLGIPELVNGYTQDGQLTQAFVDERDAYFGINSSAIREHRAGAAAAIVAPPVQQGADVWKEGIVLTLDLKNSTGNTVEFEG